MGYFPNGEAGMLYEEQYCSKCVHNDPDKGCPVLTLHMMWNYDAVGEKKDETKETALNILIPRKKDDIFNDQCAMFHASEAHP